MIIDERLRHYVDGGRQVEKKIVAQTVIVCWQCWYGECDRCLKGKLYSDQKRYEPYRHECECVHWWSALGIGSSYAEIIEAEKTAREEAANRIRDSRNRMRKAG